MSFSLRPYQKEAVTAAINYFRAHHDPAVIVLPTGAGKSLVIAELARQAKGRVLVLAHVRELVAQNHEKYQALGLTAGIFSAGLALFQTDANVIFGSVQSVGRHLSKFNAHFSLLIIDECHRVSDNEESQYQLVLQFFRKQNSQLKVLGLTATPFRLGKGWIYHHHYHGMVRGENTAFFKNCIYELPLRYMIKQGYLTEPLRLDMPVEHYDFSTLRINQQGFFSASKLDQNLQKQQRVTPLIVADIVAKSQTRCAVMIFAATVRHAEEIQQLLPLNSALITGQMSAGERDKRLIAFKAKEIKYLVNVAVLTTGFDAPHVDVIAILRPTESVSLYQQIVGRGLRLSPNKRDCLVLDYAGNNWDLYLPEPGSVRARSDSQPVQVYCPSCHFANIFWGKIGKQGEIIEHYGRRCQGLITAKHIRQQCLFRFRFKNCQNCNAENDIAAKICHECQHILVDPDDMLKAALKLRDALVLRCAGMSLTSGRDSKGSWLNVTYHDEDGATVSERFYLVTLAQKRTFSYHFLRQHQRAPAIVLDWQQPDDLVEQQNCLRAPDFVIARKLKYYWVIRHKLFDYQGRFRRAHECR